MKKMLITLSSLLLLNACSDSGGSSKKIQTASGTFIDSRVSGLGYRSGGQSGNTDKNGNFSYEVGQPVNFFLGPIDFGSSTVTSGRIMPNDLSNDANTVTNISRFLLMLDSDGDASNGIQISTVVQNSASTGTGWSTIDFSSATFESQNSVTEAIALISSLDIRTAALPTAIDAKNHLLSSLRCQHNGAFIGSYATDPLSINSPTQAAPTGDIAFIVDANSGKMHGTISTQSQQHFSISGQHANDQALNYSQKLTGHLDNSNTAYNGQFNGDNLVAGDWIDSDTKVSGAFNATRTGHSSTAVQRYTATYRDSSGNTLGFYALDIDAHKALSGIAYLYANNSTLPLTATYFPTTDSWFGTLSDSTSIALKLTGTLLSGDWTQGSTSGVISGSGCHL